MGGSFDTYRSIVNLGSGPKLFGTEFTIIDPKKRLFDRLEVRAYDWGDDPYSTLHVNAKKAKRYDFNADYRNIAYFNNLPSFADPLLVAWHRAERTIFRYPPPVHQRATGAAAGQLVCSVILLSIAIPIPAVV